ncbi:Ni/Fe-hydrogenase, b-type cytochrome subunit [Dehalobacter sp. DCM]|uniref:Ni/Fe-hydrogenase, b-type cytochrome subunit n=1 Tax=Dehalobacter sp. DCM TaxID=2907827 RepID=UPI003081F480|nr:Ni/Fe-hydrogenase, b-type cytochrome subunit [Dehalobacter sp. DCM]
MKHIAIRRPVYVWELPVRLFHWINAFAIAVLFLTGMYIANPILVAPGEAVMHFIIGTMRYWHGIAAFIFTANMIYRAFWFWAGNEYAKIRFWKKVFWQDLINTIRYYLFMRAEHRGHLGHNALAQISYIVFIWIFGVVMIFTGFAMRVGTDPSGVGGMLFSWVIPFMHNENMVRMVHHVLAWAYVVFLLIHLYLVFRQDILDDDATVSSIISGYKYELPTTGQSEAVHSSDTQPALTKGD